MKKLRLYIATTLDSYIAGPQGEIDWLDTAGAGDLDYGYHEFYASVDTTVMGNDVWADPDR